MSFPSYARKMNMTQAGRERRNPLRVAHNAPNRNRTRGTASPCHPVSLQSAGPYFFFFLRLAAHTNSRAGVVTKVEDPDRHKSGVRVFACWAWRRAARCFDRGRGVDAGSFWLNFWKSLSSQTQRSARETTQGAKRALPQHVGNATSESPRAPSPM